MLTVTIFLPALTALALLLLPDGRPRLVRLVALAGALATLGLVVALWAGATPGAGLQWRSTAAWIPAISASWDVAVDGLSLPLVALTALLLVAVMVYVLPHRESPRLHAGLILVMATGVLGVFCAQDLLLFYVFFEVALVPMYFLVGMFGHLDRRYAALKFFLYTRAGSLAMLLSFLALYLAAEPHTFSLPALAEARPLAGAGTTATLALLGLLVGFGVKLPVVPLHNWLPDAHVEAPTEGSVLLAGVLLKLGGYGMLRVMLPVLPDAVAAWAPLLLALALLSMVWGAFAALGQRDLKRLVAYTSVNHMAWVLLAVAVWGLSADPTIRALAVAGATYQMVSHGLLTGGMFFLVGVLQDQAGTRELGRIGGLTATAPALAAAAGALAFGSLGLPGFSGFVAELQVLGATLAATPWAAAIAVAALVVTTGLYVRVVVQLLMGPPSEAPQVAPPAPSRLAILAALAALSLLLGIAPDLVLGSIEGAARALGL